MPATRAVVAATTSWAVSSVRGPTIAAIINRNSGAKLIQGDRQGPQQVAVDLLGLMGRTPEPAQHRLFRDPEYKADAGQIHSDQELSLIHISEPTRLLSISYAV